MLPYFDLRKQINDVCMYVCMYVCISSWTFYTFPDRLERPDLKFVLYIFCHVLSRFHLRERIHQPNLCYANCFEGLSYGPLNKNFSRNNFSVCCCVFFH